ncbi:MAG: hypothetical protein K1X64_22445 [Myxococcaceae bacterium]|nr:hypothetical protein [Myxococcaceae bacterium]
MPSRRHAQFTREERSALLARVADLELRMKLLEARVRAGMVQARRPGIEESTARLSRTARRSRPRQRCPGCTLELPVGRKGDNCVWCGFRFDALDGTFHTR